MQDQEYLEILAEQLPKILAEAEADICFIVGGCDPLDGDPLANLKMTADGIVKRDHAIIQACAERNLPVVLTLSGGYSRDVANERLAQNNGMIASFSRALAEGLSAKQSDDDFNATLDATVQAIYDASAT